MLSDIPLFALPRGVIDRLCSVIIALLVYLLYYLLQKATLLKQTLSDVRKENAVRNNDKMK